ncbi:hypothetical protein VOLCADRAFT_96856 [Volvox carteri f. nagariensis]|uniref:Uncharacterized protein n=1 Tax=Volvox carteri f. nagariensis TaxID=3068 RepID=D8UB87_VOLCA|nr:uncharacterized protein VOLCADRAFT_96856 [Volvox carteri f. nagariensis]EFJ43068.1 hypothetical protein VOLCADRAFT_96856 [Volvox carteri f. nagariensis]|eukprot:XP_002955867.1 hypothetical protein VOLCADRAFT_96856 [Volvox carteri f. nagariensis]
MHNTSLDVCAGQSYVELMAEVSGDLGAQGGKGCAGMVSGTTLSELLVAAQTGLGNAAPIAQAGYYETQHTLLTITGGQQLYTADPMQPGPPLPQFAGGPQVAQLQPIFTTTSGPAAACVHHHYRQQLHSPMATLGLRLLCSV